MHDFLGFGRLTTGDFWSGATSFARLLAATVVAPCSGRVRAARYSYERRFVKRELQKSAEKVENQPKMIGKAALVLLLFAF